MTKTFFLILAYFFFGLLQAQNNWTSKRDKIKIPFELTHNLMIIDVTINGTPLKMIADTGATKNMIFSVPENDSLYMNMADKILISGVGVNEDIVGYLSQNNTLNVKGYIDYNFEIVYLSNSEIGIVNKLGVPINGILGSSFFKKYLVEVDYKKKLLILYKDKQQQLKKIKNKYSSTEIMIIENKPYLELKTKIDNKDQNFNLLFDTGLGDGLWLFENDTLQCNSNYFVDVLGRGLSGDVSGKKSRVKALSIQNFTLQNVLVSYPDVKYFNELKGFKSRNGSLGGEITKRFNWFLDYENQIFYFKKNDFFDSPFEYNMSGIEVEYKGSTWVKYDVTPLDKKSNQVDKEFNFFEKVINYKYELKPIYEIYAIRENSPAYRTGLRKGDLVLKINGNKASNLKLDYFNEIFQSEAGNLIKITIERMGKKMNFEFKLEKIL